MTRRASPRDQNRLYAFPSHAPMWLFSPTLPHPGDEAPWRPTPDDAHRRDQSSDDVYRWTRSRGIRTMQVSEPRHSSDVGRPKPVSFWRLSPFS